MSEKQRLFVGIAITLCGSFLGILGLLPWVFVGLCALLAVGLFASIPKKKQGKREPPAPIGRPTGPVRRKSPEEHHLPVKARVARQPRQEKTPKIHHPKPHMPKTPRQSLRDEKVEAPTRVPAGDYVTFDVELEEGEELVVELAAREELNLYVLDEENLNNLDQGQEFSYDAGSERVKNTKLRFRPEEAGFWILVAENEGKKDVTATIKVSISRSSHLVPLLKPEKLDLPDNRLDAGINL